ncbi:FxLYD domain-containing protein [Natronococcus roseus]|uniref:FxLYD domain-containing protein n=1 Tax=Natronococcus roseus TaxID=1052014 RepID=UPI00374D8CD9
MIVEARVYDEDGDKLGSHRDLTPDLEGGETWRFEIAPHSRPDGIADHDIAVAGE